MTFDFSIIADNWQILAKGFGNTVLMCNIHGHRINRDILKRVGSGYVASHGKDFMLAADPWFMGVTLRTGRRAGNRVSGDLSVACRSPRPARTPARFPG